MKFTLVVRQAAAVEAGLVGKVSPDDLCLLDYLHGWFFWEKAESKVVEGHKFVWLHFENAIEELPILFNPLAKIASRKNQLSKMIEKLRGSDLVTTKKIGGRLFIHLTELAVKVTQRTQDNAQTTGKSAPAVTRPRDGVVTPGQDKVVTSPRDDYQPAIIDETGIKENETKETPPVSPSEGEAECILACWNSFPQLLRADRITKNRARQIGKRLADPFWREHWREGVQRVASSNRLTAGLPSGWRADFDWFLKADSLTKILEGQYDTPPAPEQVEADQAQLEALLAAEDDSDKRAALREKIRKLRGS